MGFMCVYKENGGGEGMTWFYVSISGEWRWIADDRVL